MIDAIYIYRVYVFLLIYLIAAPLQESTELAGKSSRRTDKKRRSEFEFVL